MTHALHKALAVGFSASVSAMLWRTLFFTQHREDNKGIKNNTVVSRLPPELYTIIASHLLASPSTLKSCSLVSSDWLAPTRRILFYDIRLRHDNLAAFLALLASPLCTFSRFVRVLRLREGEYMVDRWVNERVVQTLAGILGGVGTLDVYNMTWRELGGRGVDGLVAGFCGGLEAVRVATCYWEGMDEFVRFVCSFGGLKHLTCESVLINGDGDGIEEQEPDVSREGLVYRPPCVLPMSLMSLSLRLPEVAMLRYFVTQPAVWGVQSLGLEVRESKLLPLAGELAGKAGAAVKDLILFLPDEGTRHRDYIFTLNHNAVLQKLRIRVATPPFVSNGYDTATTGSSWSDSSWSLPSREPSSLAWIPELIATVPSPQFQTLIFDIDASMELAASWPWLELVHVVESKPIKKVLFLVRNSSVVQRVVRRRLKEAMYQLDVDVNGGRSWKVKGLSGDLVVDEAPWKVWGVD